MPKQPEWERLKLRIEPTPRNNWGDNLAHLLYKEIWDKLRREVYGRANHRCEICGQSSKVLHCHENWGFNEKKRSQFLVSLMSLCEDCHNTIHFFRTQNEAKAKRVPLKYLDQLQAHFMRVNDVDDKEWYRHLNSKSYVMQIRNDREYSLDYREYSVAHITRRYQDLG